MEKIISLYKRDYEGTRKVFNEVVAGAEWVIRGEGTSTRKYDGTCCMIRNGTLFKRYDVKSGKSPPEGFEAAQEPDIETGYWPGWVPVGEGPNDKWHREAWDALRMLENPTRASRDGTYELCGPKIQGNPEGFSTHVLLPHGASIISGVPRTYDELKDYMKTFEFEGIVWHHPDGRMVKIKRRDFDYTAP